MKKIQCEACGSNDFLKQGGYFVCQSCGCKYNIEDVQALLKDDNGIIEPVTNEYKPLDDDYDTNNETTDDYLENSIVNDEVTDTASSVSVFTPSANSNSTNSNSAKPSKQKNMAIAIIAIIAMVVVICIVGAIFNKGKLTKSKPSSNYELDYEKTEYETSNYDSTNYASSYLPNSIASAYDLFASHFKSLGYDFSTWERTQDGNNNNRFVLFGPNHTNDYKQTVVRIENNLDIIIGGNRISVAYAENGKLDYCQFVCDYGSKYENLMYSLVDAFLSNCPSNTVLSSSFLKDDFNNRCTQTGVFSDAIWDKNNLEYTYEKQPNVMMIIIKESTYTSDVPDAGYSVNMTYSYKFNNTIAAFSASSSISYSDNYVFDSKSIENDLGGESYLAGKSKDEIQRMINTILARHGYIFKKQDNIDYFSQYDWYNPSYDDMDYVIGLFNNYEKANYNYLAKYRDSNY